MYALLLACVHATQDPLDTVGESNDSAVDTARTCHLDVDADGYGDPDSEVGCSEGGVENADDCDDTDPAVSPAAEDLCGDGFDSDCSGADARCAPSGSYETDDAEVRLSGAEGLDGAGHSVSIGADCVGEAAAGIAVAAEQGGHSSEGAGGLVYALSGGALASGILPAGGATISTPWNDEWHIGGGTQRCFADLGTSHSRALVISAFTRETMVWALGFQAPLVAEIDVEAANWRVIGEEGVWGGAISIESGDLDGDGATELVVAQTGDVSDDSGWYESMGRAYVIEPSDDPEWSVDEARATLTPYSGAAFGEFGMAMCVNDVDGDGLSDVVGGMPTFAWLETVPSTIEAGVVFVALGPLNGALTMGAPGAELGDADGRWDGEHKQDTAGGYLSCGRDVDGDGLPDILVGASEWDASDDPGAGNGAAYLVNGPALGVHSLTEATWTLRGRVEDLLIGFPVTNDSDLDADGFGDVAVGSYDPDVLGHVFLFYGGDLSGTTTPDTADATFNGGPPYDAANMVAGGGDLDGDGFDDLVIGASQDSTYADLAGAAFVVYGGWRE